MRTLTALVLLVSAASAAEITSIHRQVTVRGTPAAAHQTLATGDDIVTAPKARVEVRLDSVNEFEAFGNSEIRFTQSEAGVYRLELVKGTITWRVHAPSTGDIEVRTPNVAVKPFNPGVYELSVKDGGKSEIKVWEGDLEVVASQGSQWVGARRKMVARGFAADTEFKIGNVVPLWQRVLVVFANCAQISSTILSETAEVRQPSSHAATTSKPASSTPPSSPKDLRSSAPPSNSGNPKNR